MEKSRSISFDNLSQDFIEKMKDAFQVIDENGDGSITESDLKKVYNDLGKKVDDKFLSNMLKDGPLSFPEFLTMMGKKTSSFASKTELVECFKAFMPDDGRTTIDQEELIQYLKFAGIEDPSTQFADIFNNFTSYSQTEQKTVFHSQHFIDSITE
ncbi:hypothetical protein TBLA_0B04980 [Henningerozyma blattae CBS 6284]|uniref:EF-hand domain-containing protein n=1 Tax=Henningerozyma blattae (strain ATCC 34711 / CBS 6284 / DSM 70876 / NBRC 10599 / NRRL Y-10934 / UCD 77-7) TaxID=1071380 RepID=I2GYY1_HENB6|nr:hypothetical protein TBLA_0B04980 [Tetrapisispora blattae CBS 6284]CCH59333.1 hypothetical protein TBLA_0B04980 [Tetrapisispora blattae CBS 6284]